MAVQAGVLLRRILLILLLVPAAGVSQSLSVLDQPAGRAPVLRMTVSFDGAKGERGEGKATVAIDPRWHVNSATPKDDFAIPTVLEIESEVLAVDRIEYPPHVERVFTFAGDKPLTVYEGTIEIPFSGLIKPPARGIVRASLTYQACDDKICLPPRQEIVNVSFPDGAPVTKSPVAPTAPRGDFTPLSQAPSNPARASLFSGDIAATLESRGLLLTLFVMLILGLALNLTPCVYPLIPITVAYFAAQNEGKRSRQIALSAAYVLGLALTYSVLGVFAALSGQLFGGWLQQPAVLVFFALLMCVLAASMFGMYDIRVPQFIASRSGARTGLVGAATMGLLAGIVAAPCVGPFIVSLIALVSQSGNIYLGFTLFFVLAVGLGLPYLVLGAFSTGLNALPRSGMWMVQIKKAMGFILIAMAFYFLRPLVGDVIYRGGVGLSLLVGAAYLFFAGGGVSTGKVVRIVSAVLLLLGALWFLVPRRHGAEVTWVPYDEGALARAASAGKPLMIDFYADWCLPCKELDEKTFTDPEVVKESERFVRLKADLTRSADDKTKALSERYKILGVPTIVFVDSRGGELDDVRLVGFEKPGPFLGRMKRVP